MKNRLFISDREKEALINYLSGDFSKSDSDILNSWLQKAPENQIVLDQFTNIWRAGKFVKINKNIDTHIAWKELQSQLLIQKKSKNQIQWKRWLQIAAIVLISLLAGGLGNYFLNNSQNLNQKSEFVEFVSPLGSRSFVLLNDGSKVWMNAGSKLKYKNTYGKDNRELILTGEAFFEVEKNKKLPFVVKTAEINVIALGTKFNVKAYSEEKTIETTLVEGSVKLEGVKAKLADNLVLKPNEKAVYTKRSQSVELTGPDTSYDEVKEEEERSKPKLQIIESIEPETIISWKEKRWVINNEKLGDLAVKLERRFDVNFIFDNEVLKEFSFGGTLEDESLEQIMEAIKYSSPIGYVIDGKTVYIMADGQKMEKFKNLLME